jgi:hypothetical protein
MSSGMTPLVGQTSFHVHALAGYQEDGGISISARSESSIRDWARVEHATNSTRQSAPRRYLPTAEARSNRRTEPSVAKTLRANAECRIRSRPIRRKPRPDAETDCQIERLIQPLGASLHAEKVYNTNTSVNARRRNGEELNHPDSPRITYFPEVPCRIEKTCSLFMRVDRLVKTRSDSARRTCSTGVQIA